MLCEQLPAKVPKIVSRQLLGGVLEYYPLDLKLTTLFHCALYSTKQDSVADYKATTAMYVSSLTVCQNCVQPLWMSFTR